MSDIAALAVGFAVGFCIAFIAVHLLSAHRDTRLAETRARLHTAWERNDRQAETIRRMQAERDAAAVTVVQLSAALHQAVGMQRGAVVMDENVLSRFSWN